MFKKKTKRIASFLLAFIMILTLIPAPISATPEVNGNTETFNINTYHYYAFRDGDTKFETGPYVDDPYIPYWRYSQEYGDSQGWTGGQIVEPDCFRTSTGDVTYCLELGKAAPENTDMNYNANSLSEINDGIRRVIKMGYPNKSGEDYGTSDAELEWATAVALKIVQGKVYSTVSGNTKDSPLTLEAFSEDGILDKTFIQKYYPSLTDEQVAEYNEKADFAFDLVKTLVEYSKDETILLDDFSLEKPNQTNWEFAFEDATVIVGPYKVNFTTEEETELVLKITGVDNYELLNASQEVVESVDFNEEFYVKVESTDLGADVTKMKIEAFAANITVPTATFYSTTETKKVEIRGNEYDQPYQKMYVYEQVTLNDFDIVNLLKPEMDSIILIKKDATTQEPLANATFVFKDLDGNPLVSPWLEESYTTDEEGKIYIQLPYGFYKYQETIAPDGYILEGDDVSFCTRIERIEASNEMVVEILNTQNELLIQKVDSLTGDPIEGTIISIKDSEGIEIEGSPFTTDENGEIKLNKLPNGSYTYQEVEATEGYIIDSTEYSFEVTELGITPIVLENTPTEVILTKTDLVSGEAIPGATIEIKDSEGNHIDGSPFITDANGEIKLQRLPVGTYTFKETIAPAGYILNEEECTFTINEDGTVTGQTVLENEPNNTVLSKLDLVSGKPVPGAIIEIKDENGEPITGSPFVTDENGEIEIHKLPVGTYTFKETIAPDGYILNEEECTFTVNVDGTITGQTILKNEPIIVKANKIDSVTQEGLTDAVLGIYDKNGNLLFSEKTIEGFASFHLKAGEYKLVELEAPEGYIKTTEVVEFEVYPDGTVSKKLILENDATRLVITKIDALSNNKLENAIIEVTDIHGNEIITAPTNENGEIELIGLPFGVYIFKELEAPEGYILNNKEYKITINEDGSISGNTILPNVKTEVTFTKYDSKSQTLLTGAKFEIKDNNISVAVIETNLEGEAKISGLPVGVYTIKEITAPEGYALNDTTYVFEIKPDGSIIGTTNIPNDRISVTLYKKDAETGKLLQGAQFIVKDKDNKIVIDGITNENGEIVINKIAAGQYTLQEVAAPKGYDLNTKLYTFTVNEDGTVSGTTEIYNNKSDAPTEPTNPPVEDGKPNDDNKIDTGDTSKANNYIPLALALLATTSLIFVFKKKKED